MRAQRAGEGSTAKPKGGGIRLRLVQTQLGAERRRDLGRAPFVLDAEPLLFLLGQRQVAHAGAGQIDQSLIDWPQAVGTRRTWPPRRRRSAPRARRCAAPRARRSRWSRAS